MKTAACAAIVAAIAAAVLSAWVVSRTRSQQPAWTTLSCEHMATTISVTVPDDDRAAEAGRILSDTFAEIDAMMSEWKPGSPLAEVNEHAGDRPVEVPPELLMLIEEGIRLGEATQGAFDITWAALWGVWDFKAETPAVPDPSRIDQRRALIDFRRVEIDPDASTVFLPEPGMTIGLGGIAKGYAIDLAAERLRAAGFRDFLIAAGGQVYAGGQRGDRPWRIAVRDPGGEPEDTLGWIELRDRSASTSGDYERFFIIDGVRYHHILDPRTGWPSTGARSATVVSDRATLADALSTAAMVLDPSEATSLAERFGAWVLLIDRSGRASIASGLPNPPAWHPEADPTPAP